MTSIAQRVVYIGKETTPGTVVPVDVALRAVAEGAVIVDKIVPDEYVGSYATQRHYIGSKHFEGMLEMDGYFEHAPYPVSMAFGAGTAVTSGTPEVWTFTWPSTVTPTFATYQFEYSDGDDHIVAAPDVFATDLEISGEAGGAWVFKTTLTGGNVTYPAAVSASPTPPVATVVRSILMAETVLWMTNSYGDIGSSGQVNAALISFVWKMENLQHSKLFAGALYPTGRGHNKWNITLELVVEVANASVETIKDRLLTTMTTAIGIRSTAVDAGGSGINWYANLDGVYYLNGIPTMDERDGNNIITMQFVGQGENGEIEIGCDLAAL